jgi:hypothetical protein
MTLAIEQRTGEINARVHTPVTTRENLVTLLGGMWLTVGVGIDGYAHANIIDTATEDFFTPWHAIFYAGFIFTAGWITKVLYRRRSAGSIRSWIPDGYGWAVVGVGTFAIGGIGDGIWHTIFGVEVGIDALLSPTHLLLVFGMVLILAAPLQVAARTGGPVWVAVGSMTILSILVAFVTTFARPLSSAWVLTVPFDPRAGDSDRFVSTTVAGIVVTTLIMAVSALYLIQRFDRLPFGTFTVLWGVPAFCEAVALSSTATAATVAGVTGGLTVDVLLRVLEGPRRWVSIGALLGGTAITWSAWTLVQHLDQPIAWPPEVWTGQIGFSLFVVGGLGLLAFPNLTEDRS